MRKYGQLGSAEYINKGYNFYHMNYEYVIFNTSARKSKTVYVGSMSELKSELGKFNQEV